MGLVGLVNMHEDDQAYHYGPNHPEEGYGASWAAVHLFDVREVVEFPLLAVENGVPYEAEEFNCGRQAKEHNDELWIVLIPLEVVGKCDSKAS